MSLAEAKQLFGTLILGSTVITIAILYIAYKFAEISYKKSHKNVKKVHKKANKNVNIVFNHGSNTKDWTIFDYKEDRENMNRILKGAM